MTERPTIAVVQPYWTFWEHTAGPGFRAQRLELARRVAARFAPEFEPLIVSDPASLEEGAALGAQLASRAPDAILAVITMAVPPTYLLAALEAVPHTPVVVWALHETGLLGGDFDHGGITTQGATVGAPMLTSMLVRAGRHFELRLGRLDDAATDGSLRSALRHATVAAGIRRARLGRIGRPPDGYLHVDVDDDSLRAATGIELVPVEAEEVVEAWRAVPSRAVDDLEAEVRQGWELEGDPSEGGSLQRSLRASLALDAIVSRHRLDGGAFNCHVPQFRFGDEIGIAPCWALGRLTSAGRPFSCTGDILTAVAMLTTKRLGGAALYHEIEAVDYETGEVVIANSGEHDLAWLAPGERPRLRRNGWYCGKDPHCGVCAVFEPAPGPATLVGFAPHPSAAGGFHYVVARGQLTPRRFPETGTVNGAFRFDQAPVADAWARWAAAGVNHHSSATPGDLAVALKSVADHLGVGAVIV